MEPITIHGESTDGEPVTISCTGENLGDGTIRLSATPEVDSTFSYQGREWRVRAGSDVAHPIG